MHAPKPTVSTKTFGSDILARVARVPWAGPRIAIRLHRLPLSPAPVTWPELVDLVRRDRPAELSVDVFDTCIVRDLVGDEPVELAIAHGRDVTDPATAGPAVDLEPVDGGRVRAGCSPADRTEMLLCRPVPGVADALNEVRRAGTRITFLSDTERSSEGLEHILRITGLLTDGDRLVVSCEAGATKSGDGELFRTLWPGAATTSEAVWHVGNSRWADVTMAHKAGLSAHTLDWAEPNRYERAMAARPGTAGPAVAGAARLARLELEAGTLEPPDDDPKLLVLGADVAGQAFGAFLLWLAGQCRTEEVSQLWFLSRDGELLSHMAGAMPGDHWDGVSHGYLHCSRWSWLLAGATAHGLPAWLAAGTRDETGFIHAQRHQVSITSLLGRIGLSPSDIVDHTQLAALPDDEPLPIDAVAAWEALLTDPAIHDLISERSRVRHDLIVAYLHDLGLERGRAGLVDVGWRGRLAWAMSPIIEQVTGHPPVNFHFGSDQVLDDAGMVADIRRFAFNAHVPSAITNPVACVETLTASGRARVVDYQRTDAGTVEPVFDRYLSEIDNPDRRRLWRGAVLTAERLPTRALLARLGTGTESLGAEAIEVLELWWNAPVGAEVEAMRGLAFEDDDDGQATRPVINPYSALELTTGTRRPRLWQQGSATASPWPLGQAVRMARRLRGRMRRSSTLMVPPMGAAASIGDAIHHLLAGAI